MTLGQPGTLDASFGDNGVVHSEWPGFNTEARALALQPDGKIVVASAFAGEGAAGAIRFLPDGSRDQTFGWWGGAAGFGTPGTTPEDLAVQRDAKIVVVGQDGESESFLVVRLDEHGALDASFGKGGVAPSASLPGKSHAYGIALQRDGKVVVVGEARIPSVANAISSCMAIVRFTKHGQVDTTFGDSGKIVADSKHWLDDLRNEYASGARAVTVGPDGRIVAAGYVSCAVPNAFSPVQRIAIRCYRPDGSPDPTFGGGDAEIHQEIYMGHNEHVGSARAIAVRADGKITVVCDNAHAPAYALARYGSGGEEDFYTSHHFGGSGGVIADNASEHIGMAVQSDGEVVVAGSAAGAGGSSIAVARLSGDGEFDDSFGGVGNVRTQLPTQSGARRVVIQNDGKIVVAGYAGPTGAAWTDNMDPAAMQAANARHIIVARYDGRTLPVVPLKRKRPKP